MNGLDPTAVADSSADEFMTVLINDSEGPIKKEYIYKFNNEKEPLYKWCLIYTCGLVILGGGLITLVYFLWR